ncbi:MAG TPA: alpha/beta hydrolase [Nevskiaceae bacterium]|nr:alpha/beta hydrolase [Nevskiaceae bacterium]
MYVSIGGIDQWVQIGGSKPGLPILLYLHGGPGGTSVPASAAWKAWEEHFTVVHWDQRGAGRTFRKNGEAGCGALTVDRMVRDGIDVAQFLTHHLSQSKILVVGHSWGSALGVLMLKRRPELFAAFVGTGQLVNMRRNEEFNYQRQLAQAERQQNDEALRALRAMGPPPYSDFSCLLALREWTDRLTGGDGDALQPRPTPLAPDFTRDDVPSMQQGAEFSRRHLLGELNGIDLPLLGMSFEMPMFLFQGTHDQQTPIELAEDYFAAISAPHKAVVRFEGCHHFVVMNRPDLFLQALLTHVSPTLTKP